MKSAKSIVKKAFADAKNDPRLRDLVCAPGPGRISRARIRKAVLAVVKARTGKGGGAEKA